MKHIYKKGFLIVMLFVFSNSLCGQNRIMSYDKTYSFITLEDWEDHSESASLIFAQPLENTIDNYMENIRIDSYPSEGMSLNEYWQYYVVLDFPLQFENYQLIRFFSMKINNMDANWIEFTNEANGLKYKSCIYMLWHNDKIYSILCSAKEKDYAKTQPLFQKMANSFKIED